MELDEFIELVKEQQGIDLSGVLTTADKIGRPERALEKQAIIDFENRNPMAGGGMLVQPSADGSRPGYKQERKSKNYPNLVKEYDQIISKGLENENLKDTKTFKQFLIDKKINPKAFSEWKRKGNTGIKTSLSDARLLLARNLVDKANNGNKVVYIADIAPKIGLSWMGTNTLFNRNELALDSPKTKAIRVFNNFMTRESVPAKEMFNMVSQMADEVGITRASFSNIMKDYPDYIESRRLFKNLATPSSKKWILNNPDATFADVIDKVEGRQFRENLLGNIRSGKSSAEHKIMLYAARHERQGGNKIEFINRAGLDKNGNILDYRDIEFIYKEDPNNPKTWSKWNYDRILTEGAQSDIFKDIYKAEADLNRMLSTVVKDPRTGKDISFGKLMTDTYSTEGGHTFGFRRTPYEIDHMDSVLNDPFKNVRILPRRINQILGQVKNQANIATTPGTGMKMKNIVKYIGKNKEQILNTIDPNFANIQSIDDLINSELATSNRVFQTLKTNPELKGKVFKSSKELFNEITSMGDRAGPIDINFRTQNLNQTQLNNLLKVMQKADPQTAKDVGMVLNSGIPIDQMAAEIAKIPGAKKFARGFMKIGGPFEVAFVGLDIANEVSKGAPLDTAFQTGLSNITFGLIGDPEKYQMRDLTDAGNELGVNTQGFQELKDVLDLEKKIASEKQLLKDMQTYNEQTGQSTLRGNFDINDQTLKIQELEKSLTDKAKYLSQLDNIDTLYDDYVNAVQYLGRKEYNKTVDDRKNRVYPDMGTMGSNFMTTVLDFPQSFLPQNLMESGLGPINLATRPVVRNLRKIPFIGNIFDPTSDAAKLSAMSEEEKNKRALDMNIVKQNVHPVMGQTMTGEQLAPYYEKFFAGGGIAKIAGVDSGPPPESGPNSQGLQGLMKRVKNI